MIANLIIHFELLSHLLTFLDQINRFYEDQHTLFFLYFLFSSSIPTNILLFLDSLQKTFLLYFIDLLMIFQNQLRQIV
jgi:hypothetical protein